MLGREKVQVCVTASKETGDELQQMVEQLGLANDMVTQIASSAEEQGAVSNEMNENVTSISTSANDVSELAIHLAEQSQVLVDTCTALRQHIQYFRL